MAIDDITVVTGYRSETIESAGFKTIVNDEFASSNMVYSLFHAKEIMAGDDDLIITYGDIVYEARVLQVLLASNAPISVVVDVEWRHYWSLRMEDPLVDVETMKINDQGFITDLGKRPDGYDDIQGQFIGLIKVNRDRLVNLKDLYEGMNPDIIYDGQSYRQMYMTSFIQHAINQSWPVKAVLVSNGWLEVDTVADLELYQKMEADGSLADIYKLEP